MRTAQVAWDTVTPGASHQLVLQDDVDAPDDFLDLVRRAVLRHPAEPLAFYAHWNSRNGAAVRLAALSGASWVRCLPEEFTPTQAICLPADMAGAFRQYANPSTDRRDDEVLSSYLRCIRRMSLVAVPNLVEHSGAESLCGNDSEGVRRSPCLVTSTGAVAALGHGWVLEDTVGLPYMRRGWAHARVAGPDGILGDRGHTAWQDALPYLGLDAEQMQRLVRTHRPRDLAEAVERWFGSHFTSEFWIYCLLLGRQARLLTRPSIPPSPEVRAAALATLGVSSLPPLERTRLTPDQGALLLEFTRSGLRGARYA
ncbi:hypothetical protein AB0I10_32260 [Streptomyces sp. NPDC050636]|uniref:hypothetical protein n=1 Tax=Streptomyces sp. NPDC050636 TaxID=3154510 RepID=UPI0034372A84